MVPSGAGLGRGVPQLAELIYRGKMPLPHFCDRWKYHTFFPLISVYTLEAFYGLSECEAQINGHPECGC
jgi:hypothetical protein